ncbi:MAG TPA: hypothetical protein VFS96_01575, partial [Nitrolancea sp.]|nr:hypothetical protein [Nitrolancea sp.]
MPTAAIIGLAIVLIVGAFVALDFLNNQEQVTSTERPTTNSGTPRSVAPAASATPRPSPAMVMASPSPSPSAAATEDNPGSTPTDSGGDQDTYEPGWIDDSGSASANSSSEDTNPGSGTGGNDASADSSQSTSQAIVQTPPVPSPAPSNPPALSPEPSTSPSPPPASSNPPVPSPSPSSAPGHFGPADPATANPGCTYFPETQHNLCGGFRDYLNKFGGLAVFGLPLTEEFHENGVTIQYFERARFEWHPGSWTERYDVRLGLVGNTVTAGRSGEAPFQPTGANGNCTYYSQTHHNLCGGFRDYWNKFGGLAVYGMPISEEFEERNPDDGQIYTVQYFERARFEWHPGASPERFDVVL